MGTSLSVIGLVTINESEDGYVQWVDAPGGKLLGVVPYYRLHYTIGESVSESLLWAVPRLLYLPFYLSWQLFLKFTFFSAGISLYFFVMLVGFLVCWLVFWSLSDVAASLDLLDTLLDIPVTFLNLAIFAVNYAYGMLRPMIPMANSMIFNVLRLFYTAALEVATTWNTIAAQADDMFADGKYAGTTEIGIAESRSMAEGFGLTSSLVSGTVLGAVLGDNTTRELAASSYGPFVPCYRRLAHGLTEYEDPSCAGVLAGDTYNSARMWAVNVMVNLAVLVIKVVSFLIRGLMWSVLEGIFQMISFFTSGTAMKLVNWFLGQISRGLTNVAEYIASFQLIQATIWVVVEVFSGSWWDNDDDAAAAGGGVVGAAASALLRSHDASSSGGGGLGESGTPRRPSLAFTRARHYVRHGALLARENKTAYHSDVPPGEEDIRDTLRAVVDTVMRGAVPNDTWCGVELSRVRTKLRREEEEEETPTVAAAAAAAAELEKLEYGEQWSFVACTALYATDAVSHFYVHTEPGTFLSPVKLLRGFAALLNSTAPEWLQIETELSKFSARYDSTPSTAGRLYHTLRHVGGAADPQYLEYLDEDGVGAASIDEDDSWDTNTRFLHNTAVSLARGLRTVDRDVAAVHSHNTKLRRSLGGDGAAARPDLQRAHLRRVRRHLRKTTDSIRGLVSTLERSVDAGSGSKGREQHKTKPWTTNMQFEERMRRRDRKEHTKASGAEQRRYAKMQEARGEAKRRARSETASSRSDPSNFLLRWIARTFAPNREGSVPFLDVFNPSKSISRILNTVDCWWTVDFGCNYSFTGTDAADAAADAAFKDCKTACAEQQATELGKGVFRLEEVAARTELCLEDCERAREAEEEGFFASIAGGLAGFFQMCWPPNRNGVSLSDERTNNETQCFPQMDELFHLEYFYFNFEQWLLDSTASENSGSVCADSGYSLEVWEECSPRGMWLGACVYLFDWLPIYVGVSNAFLHKVNNFGKAFGYAFGTLLLPSRTDDADAAAPSQREEDRDFACFVLVGLWSLIWGFLILLLLIFVFVVFDTVSYSVLNFALSPVYFACSVFDALPKLPPRPNDPAFEVLFAQQLELQKKMREVRENQQQQQKSTSGSNTAAT